MMLVEGVHRLLLCGQMPGAYAVNTSTTSTAYASGPDIKGVPCLVRFLKVPLIRANPEINFRNGGSAGGSLARRGDRPIPRKGWDPFFPPRLGLPTQHSQRPLAAPALSQAILSEVLGRRPGAMACLRCQSHKAKVYGHWPLTLLEDRPFASAIWKFLSGFALIQTLGR